MKTKSTGELRVIVRGLAVLFVVSAIFAVGKVAWWQSKVVHEERTSIHREFPGGVVIRFPQEAVNMADLFTGAALAIGGVIAFGLAFGMGERLRNGRVTSSADAKDVRAFFTLAGLGLLWLAFDEVFLVHEMISANFYIGDSWILLGYAAAGGLAVLWWNRVLRASGPALAVCAFGALLHGASLGLDFVQDSIGWAPEEPLEMLAAGFYALGMATYFVRLVLAGSALPAALTASAATPAATHAPMPPMAADPAPAPVTLHASALDLPDSAIAPLTATTPGARPDPAWIR